MKVNNDVVEAIGHTPLIKLKRASEETACTILGKAEFMNPGQSVKDRAGKWMILEAEKRGDLRPGGLVVEATAGNTGIGLAVVHDLVTLHGGTARVEDAPSGGARFIVELPGASALDALSAAAHSQVPA